MCHSLRLMMNWDVLLRHSEAVDPALHYFAFEVGWCPLSDSKWKGLVLAGLVKLELVCYDDHQADSLRTMMTFGGMMSVGERQSCSVNMATIMVLAVWERSYKRLKERGKEKISMAAKMSVWWTDGAFHLGWGGSIETERLWKTLIQHFESHKSRC